MILKIFFIICIVGAIFSRTTYYDAGKRLDDKNLYLFVAVSLDIASSMTALLILMTYWNIITYLN